MSFKEWLYDELLSQEFITEDDFEDAESLTEEELLSSTELESWDLDELKNQFALHCRKNAIVPIMDLE